MDRNTIGNEIEAEINASYRYKNLRELIDILLSVIILKTGKKELVVLLLIVVGISAVGWCIEKR